MLVLACSFTAPNSGSLEVQTRMRIICLGARESLWRSLSSSNTTSIGAIFPSNLVGENADSERTCNGSCGGMIHFGLPSQNHSKFSMQTSQCRALVVSNSVRYNDIRTFSHGVTQRKSHLNSFQTVPRILGIRPFFPIRSMGNVSPKKIQSSSTKKRTSSKKAIPAEMDNSPNEILDVDSDDVYDDDELMDDNDAFIDDMLEEEGEGVDDIMLGDGGDGGGVNLGQMEWGEKAFSIAKGVLKEFGSNFLFYAFKVSTEGRVYVRLDKLSDKYGSPSMVEIESFSTIYGRRLEEAGQQRVLPDNLALEVSSPGAERMVEVPNDLLRFKDLPMFVRYAEAASDKSSQGGVAEKDAILELESLELEAGTSIWKVANVRTNREQSGKGRPLTKKQKEWRIQLPFSSLNLVRLYLDI